MRLFSLFRQFSNFNSVIYAELSIKWKIFKEMLLLNQENILADIGGGEGYWTRKISPLVKACLLLDLEQKSGGYQGSLSRAKKTRYHNTYFLKADALHLPLKDKSVDKILSNQVLEHISIPERALAEMSRVLRNSGIIVVSVPNSEVLDRYKFNITKLLRRFLPRSLNSLSSFWIGDFVRYGYEGWERRVGHVHRGFYLSELRKNAESLDLMVSSVSYVHKSIFFLELAGCLPFLTVMLAPIILAAYLLEKMLNIRGADSIISFTKRNEAERAT